jgi:hypothetical protein
MEGAKDSRVHEVVDSREIDFGEHRIEEKTVLYTYEILTPRKPLVHVGALESTLD